MGAREEREQGMEKSRLMIDVCGFRVVRENVEVIYDFIASRMVQPYGILGILKLYCVMPC